MLRAVGQKNRQLSGTSGSRPAASPGYIGYMYFDTTTQTLYECLDGISWQQVSPTVLMESLGLKRNRDTYANLIASTTGWNTGDVGYATDYGVGRGVRMIYNGSAWRYPSEPQLIGRSYEASTTAADTSENTVVTVSIPPLQANSSLILYLGSSFTGSTNSKRTRVKLTDGTTTTTGYNTQTTTAGDVGFYSKFEIRNRNNPDSQIWTRDDTLLYGYDNGVYTTGTVNTDISTGTTLTVTAQKGLAGETYTREFFALYLQGGD